MKSISSLKRCFFVIVILLFFLTIIFIENTSTGAELPSIPRNGSRTVANYGTVRVNIPCFTGDISFDQCGIFWFGKVDSDDNYADVRVGYNQDELRIHIAVFDRRLWYDESQPDGSLTAWDAVTLYLYAGSTPGAELDRNAYQFVGQLNWWEAPEEYRRTLRGDNGSWVDAPISITTSSGWRGNAPNDNSDDRGWVYTFQIPFTGLGLSAPPPGGTLWRMAIVLHDRDNAQGDPPIPDKHWPSGAISGDRPDTWAEIAFGLPQYTPSTRAVAGSIMVRDRYLGVRVGEISVGGSSTCGEGRDFWTEWGYVNDPSGTLVVQNQSDVADWPCFSKIFFEFPLDSVPRGKEIVEAKLVLHLFGNSDPSGAQPSYIQVLVVGTDYDIQSLAWNSAPYAAENVGGTWVNPIAQFPGWPGVPYEWDVSYAVAQAYAAGKPLRLALYSADSAYHSGKYFVGSTDDGWNEQGRPTLYVSFGEGKSRAMPWIPLLLLGD